ncbi:CoA ester lyase (plasmid) [Mycolicibacterium madagascariense]|uniref:CoA ester lyase n=1 Tax=Mycolicibacterium madagascariense TaxID=212765 RepID=A0A7I7XPW5_9MYCO|nr:CoA ester lyase [Mycolicibacterium madagascariense]BBZ31235.1 CoA ester lyase [Mycolicibacterium madagascariense]
MTAHPSDAIRAARSLLFVPGDRPDRFAKAVAAGPDLVVIDLEDAVGAADKDAARENARAWLAAGETAVVRINGSRTSWYEADLDMMCEHGTAAMVPKAEDPALLERLARSGISVVPLVETACGVSNARELAMADGVQRLAFGSIDLAAELGVDPTDRQALLVARSALVLASAAARLPGPVDGVTTALTDRRQLVDDVTHARTLGFTAKLCVHPSQVAAVHDATAPSADEVAWAQTILTAADPAGSATTVDGEMVDAPVLSRAQRIIDQTARA